MLMAELAGNASVYRLLPYINNYQISKPLFYSVWIKEKKKTGNFVLPCPQLYLAFDQFTQY